MHASSPRRRRRAKAPPPGPLFQGICHAVYWFLGSAGLMLVIFGIAQRGLDALDGAALALVMFVLGLFVVPAMMILGFLMGMRSARRKQIAWLSAEG
ncbi:MAG: hypothetical protein H6712_28135 [Myxococcales bacterium]|nr:hypothetical protein [Myxococcales bacterium]MCB9717751.1 hypothetical protein [Myxococcales bacterium]